MKRKIYCLLCFIFLLACSALIMHCSGSGDSPSGNGGIGGGETEPPQQTIGITTEELVAAAGTSSTFHLPGDIDFWVTQAYSADGGTSYTIVIKIKSPGYVRGFTAYAFSARGIETDYYHYDKWQSMWAEDPPAGNQIRQEKNISQFPNCRMLGSSFNRSQSDLGEMRIKTIARNSHFFVIETHNPTIG